MNKFILATLCFFALASTANADVHFEASVVVHVPSAIVIVIGGGSHRHYRQDGYYSPYDSGPFGYPPGVVARGSHYSPPMGNCGCNHRPRRN